MSAVAQASSARPVWAEMTHALEESAFKLQAQKKLLEDLKQQLIESEEANAALKTELEAMTERCDNLAPTLMSLTNERNQLAKDKAALIAERNRLQAALDNKKARPAPAKPSMLSPAPTADEPAAADKPAPPSTPEMHGEPSPPPPNEESDVSPSPSSNSSSGAASPEEPIDASSSSSSSANGDDSAKPVHFAPASSKYAIPTDLSTAKAFFLGAERYSVQYKTSDDLEYEEADAPPTSPLPFTPLPTPSPVRAAFGGRPFSVDDFAEDDEFVPPPPSTSPPPSPGDAAPAAETPLVSPIPRGEGEAEAEAEAAEGAFTLGPEPDVVVPALAATATEASPAMAAATVRTPTVAENDARLDGNATPEDVAAEPSNGKRTKGKGSKSVKRSLFGAITLSSFRKRFNQKDKDSNISSSSAATAPSGVAKGAASPPPAVAENPWFDVELDDDVDVTGGADADADAANNNDASATAEPVNTAAATAGNATSAPGPMNVVFLSAAEERDVLSAADAGKQPADGSREEKRATTRRRASQGPSKANHDAAVQLRSKIAEAEAAVAVKTRALADARWLKETETTDAARQAETQQQQHVQPAAAGGTRRSSGYTKGMRVKKKKAPIPAWKLVVEESIREEERKRAMHNKARKAAVLSSPSAKERKQNKRGSRTACAL